MKGITTIILLIVSNTFMTFAWYGHLKWLKNSIIITIILASWAIAFFEYVFQVPANRLGFSENGGPFSLVQLKVIQEVITLIVFTVFSTIVFKNNIGLNQIIGFLFLVFAVYFIFQK